MADTPPETFIGAIDLMMVSESESEIETTETETGEDTTELDDAPVKKRKVQISMSLVYNCAKMITNVVLSHPREEINWSPTPQNFDLSEAEESVPPELYN